MDKVPPAQGSGRRSPGRLNLSHPPNVIRPLAFVPEPMHVEEDGKVEASAPPKQSFEIEPPADAGSSPSEVLKAAAGSYVLRLRKSPILLTGTIFMLLGVLVAIGSQLLNKIGHSYRIKKITENLVISSEKNPQYKAWATNTDTKTPMYSDYTIFNITNPTQFLNGENPVVAEVGPFTFVERASKYNINFSDGGKLVSYVQLSQLIYTGNPKDLESMVWGYNLPYAVAMATIGGEKNIISAGTQQAVLTVEKALKDTFVPAVREAAVATCINESINALQDALASVTFNNKAGAKETTLTRWGGGCTTIPILGKSCGFGAVAAILSFADPKNTYNGDLLQTCIYTRLPQDNAIAPSIVVDIMDKDDPYSVLNTEINEDTLERKGVSYWLWGNDTMKATIMNHYGINNAQFDTLRTYLRSIYNSNTLQQSTMTRFYDSFEDKTEKSSITYDVTEWNDFGWRQWAVGDVYQRLTNATKPISMMSNGPQPEFAWYAESVNVQTFKYTGSYRWSKDQALCFFEQGHKSFFTYLNEVLSISVDMPSRASFLMAGLTSSSSAATQKAKDCFRTTKDWTLLQGYLKYLADNFVEPMFENSVLHNNSALLTHRPIREMLGSYQSPILQLSLAADDPRARNFSIAVNDTSLDGPAQCLAAADMSNQYTACILDYVNTTKNPDGSTSVWRSFKKVPHTYYTGKGDVKRAGALAKYHGDKNIYGIWRNGSILIDGGAKSYPSSVQYGYSLGRQFPPFNAISKPDAVLSVFEKGFIVPFRFTYLEDVTEKGIALKKFAFSNDTFSISRPDAGVFSMSGASPMFEGLLNLTDVVGAPAYFSKPHHGTDSIFAKIGNYTNYNAEDDDSFIEIEPITGMTMGARMQLQFSVAVPANLYSTFHPKVPDIPALPIMYIRQHANVSEEDADFFKKQVYGSEKMITAATAAVQWIGIALIGLGLVLIAFDYARWRTKSSSSESASASATAAGATQATIAYKATGPYPV